MISRQGLFAIVLLCAGIVEQPRAEPQDSQPQTLRILPLGDSITYGVRAERQAGYRLELTQLLDAAGKRHELVGTRNALHPADRTGLPHNGYPGLTVRQILTTLREADVFAELESRTQQADVVLLHVGTNDLSAPEDTASRAAQDVRELLQYLDEQRGHGLAADATVMLAKIIPHTRGRNPRAFDLGRAYRTQRFNNLLLELVNEDSFHFVRTVNMFDIPMSHIDLERLGVEEHELDARGDRLLDWLLHLEERWDGPGPTRGQWHLNRRVMIGLHGEDGGEVAYDGLHPTALGYRVMAHQWFAHLQQLYGSSSARSASASEARITTP